MKKVDTSKTELELYVEQYGPVNGLQMYNDIMKERELVKHTPKPPGSLAEFESYYTKKGGDLQSIIGTPKFAEEWQKWKKESLTPAANIKVDIAGSVAAETQRGRSEAMASVKLTTRELEFVNRWTTALAEDRATPSQVKAAINSGGMGGADRRMAIGQTIWNDLYQMRPDYNTSNAEANYKAKSSTLAISRMQLAKTVEPIAEEVKIIASKIPQDFDFVPLNEQAMKIRRYLNNEELASLEFNKNKMVEEFERMLTGAQMADERVKRNLDLIRTGYSPRTLIRLANDTLKIVGASKEAVSSPMYSTGTPVTRSGNPKSKNDLESMTDADLKKALGL
jgi:hypothetical protein